ncbi:MAG: hypothetical protein ABR955_14635 [Verrucomicrobiota bacterium]
MASLHSFHKASDTMGSTGEKTHSASGLTVQEILDEHIAKKLV